MKEIKGMKRFLKVLFVFILMLPLFVKADTEINKIELGGISLPVNGIQPTKYDASVRDGSNYSIDYDSIKWYDITTGIHEMGSTETFVLNHNYRMDINIIPSSGYSFVDASNMSVEVRGLLLNDDYTYQVVNNGNNRKVYVIMQCLKDPFLFTNMTLEGDYDVPTIGDSPVNPTVRIATINGNLNDPNEAPLANVKSAEWYKKLPETEFYAVSKLNSYDVFEEGETYVLRVVLRTANNYWFFDNSIDNIKINNDVFSRYEITDRQVGFQKEYVAVNKYTVSFNSKGGSSVSNQIVIQGNKVQKVTNPTRTGWVFDGWYEEEGYKNLYDFDKPVDHALTLYAKWKVQTFTVKFETNGGSSVANQTVKYADYIVWPDNPKKNGQEFLGWYSDSALTKEFYWNTPIDKNMTIYAKWGPADPVLSISKGDNNSLQVSISNYDSSKKYVLERKTEKSKWSKVTDMSSNSYVNKSLTYGTKYYYRVKTTLNDKVVYSNEVSATAKPNTVQNLKIVSGGTKNLQVSYNKVSATGYEVQYGTDGVNFKRAGYVTKSKTLKYNVKKLKANTTYYFRVRAYKTVKGKKKYGEWSTVVSGKTAPNKTKVSIKYNKYNANSVIPTSVSGASYYEIYRSVYKNKKFSRINNTSDTTNGYVDSNLTVGKTYYYKVKACNSEGRCSDYSGVSSKKVLPNTPVMNVKSIEEKKVTIDITAGEGSQGYEVQRSTKKKTGYKKIKTLTDVLSFENSTTSGKTYYYRARSWIKVNGKKVYSKWSDVSIIKSM